MKIEQKNWSKTLLTTYSYLETICGAIDKKVLTYGTSCSTNGTEFLANKIISLTERKKFLINVKILVDSALKNIEDEKAKILVLKFVDRLKTELITSVLKMPTRTYFRKVNLAIDSFSNVLLKSGYDSTKLSQIFRSEDWILEIYNNFAKKIEKKAEFDALKFLNLAFQVKKTCEASC